ncbi:hypothetical protein I7V34_14785 [Bacillus sp. V3]|uniref:hypothetical protein n=1 Tax=Bacillus sp. Marseille-Q1617 TaxID=2736887 RepID=UPI00158DA31B|nr:hypothetical protein [Bacillus sp. Marseille-Q1617]QTC40437.1 hypothetical protein I7V34_14785 [Bacillus sp. V3]
MKKFIVLGLSIAAAAPLSAILLVLSDVFLKGEEYSLAMIVGSIMTITFYEIIIYLVVGIPVTLIINFIKKRLIKNQTRDYLVTVALYLIPALLVAYLLLEGLTVENLAFVLIPVYVYMHFVYFFEKKFVY